MRNKIKAAWKSKKSCRVETRICSSRTMSSRQSKSRSSGWAFRTGSHISVNSIAWLKKKYSWDSITSLIPKGCTTSKRAWPNASLNSSLVKRLEISKAFLRL
jgi:hypothetical protein